MTMRQRKPACRRDEAGLTLVEMMVSVLLAAILSAGLFYMTSGQQRTYNAQIDTLQLQESLWGAMEYLKRQVRGAGRGFGACVRGKVYDGDPGTPANARIHALRIFNGCSVADSGTTLDNNSALDTCMSTNTNSSDSFAITTVPETDAAGLRLMTQVTRQPAGTTLTLPIPSNSGFPMGDYVIVYPFGDTNRQCVLRRITGAIAPTFPSQPWWLVTTESPNGVADPIQGYLGGTLVVSLGTPTMPPTPPVTTRYFSIDTSKSYPRLITWTTTDISQPNSGITGGNIGRYDIVAEGIEDMQISWACDVNDDTNLTEGQDNTTRLNDEWAFNVAGDTVPNCGWRTPAAVRITLIGRTRSANPQYKTGFRPAAEDRVAGTVANDQGISGGEGTFARRVLTVVVRPENMAQPRVTGP